MNTQPAHATFLIATAALEAGVCMNWGYIISAAIRSPLNVGEVRNLPSPFFWFRAKDNPIRGFSLGLGIIATYLALPIEPLDYCIDKFGIAGLPLFFGGHYIAYSLAKRALQQGMNRQYCTAPVSNPVIPGDLQKEALFSAALEKDTRDNYSKIPEKDRRTCPICYETISPENLHITRCEQKESYAVHYYCKKCIQQWKQKDHLDCPTCKGTMLSFRTLLPRIPAPLSVWQRVRQKITHPFA